MTGYRRQADRLPATPHGAMRTASKPLSTRANAARTSQFEEPVKAGEGGAVVADASVVVVRV